MFNAMMQPRGATFCVFTAAVEKIMRRECELRKVLSVLSKNEISLQIFESKLFLRGNGAKSLFSTVFFNKFHRITNLIALLYFIENRLLKIWSPKDKYIQIPI
jgi:hypothetical protein